MGANFRRRDVVMKRVIRMFSKQAKTLVKYNKSNPELVIEPWKNILNSLFKRLSTINMAKFLGEMLYNAYNSKAEAIIRKSEEFTLKSRKVA